MKSRHVMSAIALALGVSTLRAIGQSDAPRVHSVTPENHRPTQAPTPGPTPPNTNKPPPASGRAAPKPAPLQSNGPPPMHAPRPTQVHRSEEHTSELQS